jgi:LysR family transcriptional regulator, nod-box dependent transcriptional activator
MGTENLGIMRHSKLDLNLLNALRVLLKEKSVTRAGEVLHVTQSAMSGILGRLRDYFDDPLIVPVGRKMDLTPLAQSLLQPVNDLLLRIDATIRLRPEFDPSTTRRHFTLVASDYTVSVLLATVLKLAHRDAPGLTVGLSPPSEHVTQELESGDVDFVIMPEIFTSPTQSSQVLFNDSYVVVVWKQSPVGDTITLERYLELGHVAYQAEKNRVPVFERWFTEKYGYTRRVEVSAYSFQLLPYLVVGTDRVATMHQRFAEQQLAGLPVRCVRPLFEVPEFDQVLHWHKYRDLDPGSQWLRDRIIEAAQALPPLEELSN